jgi:MFS family permease
MKIRVNIDIKVGRLVKFFVISDFFLLAGWGFIDPVFSVFIVQKIVGGTLITVGVAAAIYWILKSILQIPIAKYLDKTPGEKDDLMALIGGLLLAGFSAAAFTLVHTAAELYFVEALHAIAFAFYAAAWPAIFSRHLDKDRFAFDWSLDSVTVGVASGITGLLGGIIAENWSYTAVFMSAAALSFVAAFVLIAAPDLILPKPNRGEVPIVEHKEPEIGV